MSCLRWDCENKSDARYARVPTASNVADGPSRMDPTNVVSVLGGTVVPPVFPGIPFACRVL